MRSIAVSPPIPAAVLGRRSIHFSHDYISVSQLSVSTICLQSSTGGKPVGWPLGGAVRIACSSKRIKRAISNNHIFASVAEVSLDQTTEISEVPKGDMWSVHKFGGTCMGTAKRIRTVADIIVQDSSERKLAIVSAMSKVTDMMYNLVQKAQSRDDSYITALDDVFEKHLLTAKELLDVDDLERFLSLLHNDISNLKAMLRAIYIGSNL